MSYLNEVSCAIVDFGLVWKISDTCCICEVSFGELHKMFRKLFSEKGPYTLYTIVVSEKKAGVEASVKYALRVAHLD